MRIALLLVLAVAAPASAGSGKVAYSIWTPPAGCTFSSQDTLLVVDASNAPSCKLGVSWKRHRLVRVSHSGVNQSTRVVTVRKRKGKLEVVIEVTSICRGAAMMEDWQQWLLIPSGRAPVAVVTVPGPRDPNPFLAP